MLSNVQGKSIWILNIKNLEVQCLLLKEICKTLIYGGWTEVKEVRASSTDVNKLMSKKLEHLQIIYGQWIDVKEVRAYPTDDL
jgi:hypothetical protein